MVGSLAIKASREYGGLLSRLSWVSWVSSVTSVFLRREERARSKTLGLR